MKKTLPGPGPGSVYADFGQIDSYGVGFDDDSNDLQSKFLGGIFSP